jgi:CHRD domain-containing protein
MRRFLIISVTALAALTVLTAAQARHRPGDNDGRHHRHSVAICHRTSSETTPYVRIRVFTRAQLRHHRQHAEDVIPAPHRGCPRTLLSPTTGGTPVAATLSGAAEVPGPGDTDGTGSATLRLRKGQGQICFQVAVQNVALPSVAAHIHKAATGVAGPIVATLTAPDATGTSSGCARATRLLVNAILANPAGYYINVHTTDFPDGAARGQLAP